MVRLDKIPEMYFDTRGHIMSLYTHDSVHLTFF